MLLVLCEVWICYDYLVGEFVVGVFVWMLDVGWIE